MAVIPDILHALTGPSTEGFAAKPAVDNAEGHAAFQEAVRAFSTQQLDWELLTTQAGRYGHWVTAVFIPA